MVKMREDVERFREWVKMRGKRMSEWVKNEGGVKE